MNWKRTCDCAKSHTRWLFLAAYFVCSSFSRIVQSANDGHAYLAALSGVSFTLSVGFFWKEFKNFGGK